jgi:hypothetical protein
MQVDLTELRKFLPADGGRLSFEFRDGCGRLIASAKLDVASQHGGLLSQVVEPDRSAPQLEEDPPGPNFLSILT